MGDKDGPILSFATKYYPPATYHINVKATSFAVMRSRFSRIFEILTLDINNTGPAIEIT